MGRVAGWMFLAGSVTTVMAIVFPHSPEADIAGFWAMAAGTAVLATLLLGLCHRLPPWSLQGVMCIASLTVALSLYFNGERQGGVAADNEVLFLWVALYAGYFFSRRQLAAQLAFAALAYAAVLLLIHPGQVGFTRWLITTGMISAAGSLVHVLKRRNDHLLTQLSDTVRTDTLTGLVSRYGFDERFEEELERSRRTAQPLALILADVDSFKAINDRFGHPAGDAALAAVGQAFTRAARTIDIAARIGGDEFAIVLPATGARGAFALAERLRGEIAGLADTGGELLSMSFGVAEFPLHGSARHRLIQAADKALYEAKSAGRNRSVVAPGWAHPPTPINESLDLAYQRDI